MNKHIKFWFWSFFVLLLTAALALAPERNTHPANAAGSALDYSLDWFTVDGGGVTNLTGGAYTLGGTFGQPDAGALSGGQITLNGGFWGGVNTGGSVFIPLIKR